MKRQLGGNSSRTERQKRTKSFHCSKEKVGGKSTFSIQPNMAGVLVMCTRGRESRAIKEAINLFNQYADELYPETKMDNKEVEDTEGNGKEDDLEASIAKELAELKEPKPTKKRFTSIATGTDCMLFIRICDEIEPSKFIHDILVDMQAKQIKRTRNISRFLPVQKTCNANLNEIERVGRLIVPPQFNSNKNENDEVIPKTFSVNARIRNCTKIDRMEVTKTFASIVGLPHKVDLTDPELVIIVEICQTMCMMSVVSDYGKLRKYNLESLLGLNDTTKSGKKNDEKVTATKQSELESVKTSQQIESSEVTEKQPEPTEVPQQTDNEK
ncbi:unnamed protein product [Cunninghamella echinulata]